MLDEIFEKYGGAQIVGPDVTLNLVHRLAYPDFCGQVKNGIDVFDGALDHLRIAHVAVNEFSARIEVLRLAAGVYLWHQQIEHAHRVPSGYQSISKVRTDESSTAGDQYI